MLLENRYAIKEWASVCAALAAGRQSLILRKGGLLEIREGFQIAHREFWLFPTAYHQHAECLIDSARPFYEQAITESPAPGTVALQSYATVERVHQLADESLLARLTGLHIWTDRIVHDRFHYRQPGLFVLVVRMYQRTAPYVLPDSPHFAGCRSWVDLPVSLSTEGLQPVLSDDDHARMVARIEQALAFAAWV